MRGSRRAANFVYPFAAAMACAVTDPSRGDDFRVPGLRLENGSNGTVGYAIRRRKGGDLRHAPKSIKFCTNLKSALLKAA